MIFMEKLASKNSKRLPSGKAETSEQKCGSLLKSFTRGETRCTASEEERSASNARELEILVESNNPVKPVKDLEKLSRKSK